MSGRLHALARLKMLLCRLMVVPEFCRDCGRRVEQVWQAGDWLWNEINPRAQDGPPLCIRCFDRRAWRNGVLLRWVPVVDERRDIIGQP